MAFLTHFADFLSDVLQARADRPKVDAVLELFREEEVAQADPQEQDSLSEATDDDDDDDPDDTSCSDDCTHDDAQTAGEVCDFPAQAEPESLRPCSLLDVFDANADDQEQPDIVADAVGTCDQEARAAPSTRSSEGLQQPGQPKRKQPPHHKQQAKAVANSTCTHAKPWKHSNQQTSTMRHGSPCDTTQRHVHSDTDTTCSSIQADTGTDTPFGFSSDKTAGRISPEAWFTPLQHTPLARTSDKLHDMAPSHSNAVATPANTWYTPATCLSTSDTADMRVAGSSPPGASCNPLSQPDFRAAGSISPPAAPQCADGILSESTTETAAVSGVESDGGDVAGDQVVEDLAVSVQQDGVVAACSTSGIVDHDRHKGTPAVHQAATSTSCGPGNADAITAAAMLAPAADTACQLQHARMEGSATSGTSSSDNRPVARSFNATMLQPGCASYTSDATGSVMPATRGSPVSRASSLDDRPVLMMPTAWVLCSKQYRSPGRVKQLRHDASSSSPCTPKRSPASRSVANVSATGRRGNSNPASPHNMSSSPQSAPAKLKQQGVVSSPPCQQLSCSAEVVTKKAVAKVHVDCGAGLLSTLAVGGVVDGCGKENQLIWGDGKTKSLTYSPVNTARPRRSGGHSATAPSTPAGSTGSSPGRVTKSGSGHLSQTPPAGQLCASPQQQRYQALSLRSRRS